MDCDGLPSMASVFSQPVFACFVKELQFCLLQRVPSFHSAFLPFAQTAMESYNRSVHFFQQIVERKEVHCALSSAAFYSAGLLLAVSGCFSQRLSRVLARFRRVVASVASLKPRVRPFCSSIPHFRLRFAFCIAASRCAAKVASQLCVVVVRSCAPMKQQ
jgi:hypothetical protein